MTEVGEHTKQALLELYKEKKNLADKYRVISGDNCPDVSKLEKEISDMEGFFTKVLGIDLRKIKT